MERTRQPKSIRKVMGSLSCIFLLVLTYKFWMIFQGGSGEYDPQTEADRASQKCIIGSLLRVYPTLRIIGEEEVCNICSWNFSEFILLLLIICHIHVTAGRHNGLIFSLLDSGALALTRGILTLCSWARHFYSHIAHWNARGNSMIDYRCSIPSSLGWGVQK